jgi:hypothetical protein
MEVISKFCSKEGDIDKGYEALVYIYIYILLLLTAIGFLPGGSVQYTSTENTNTI